MGAILIKADSKSLKLITELAKQLGCKVSKLENEQLENIAFVEILKVARTSEKVSRETVMRELK